MQNDQAAASGDAVAWCVKASRGSHIQSVNKAQVEVAVWLFLRPKMVRVRLLSRDFLSELSFFVDRPERTERASEVLAVSSLYLSL